MKKNGEFVGVNDEFVPEEEKYVDDSILGNKQERDQKLKSAVNIGKKIGIGYLCFAGIVVILFIVIFDSFFSRFFKIQDMASDVIDKATDQIGTTIDQMGASTGTSNDISNQASQADIKSFNRDYELYSGTGSRLMVRGILDTVVTNNKTNSARVITVVYNTTTTTDPNEIVILKQSFELGKEYEVMLDYGTDGYVNKVTILDIQ